MTWLSVPAARPRRCGIAELAQRDTDSRQQSRRERQTLRTGELEAIGLAQAEVRPPIRKEHVGLVVVRSFRAPDEAVSAIRPGPYRGGPLFGEFVAVLIAGRQPGVLADARQTVAVQGHELHRRRGLEPGEQASRELQSADGPGGRISGGSAHEGLGERG